MALAPGTFNVSVSVVASDATLVTGSATFVASPAVVVGVEIFPASVSLSLSSSPAINLHANAHFSDGSTGDASALVTWSVESTAVASVTSAGRLTAVASGVTTVLATLGSLSGSAPVQVTP